jgi:hypothetical protein
MPPSGNAGKSGNTRTTVEERPFTAAYLHQVNWALAPAVWPIQAIFWLEWEAAEHPIAIPAT